MSQPFLLMRPVESLPNGFRVSPTLWRSAEPTDWSVLPELGIIRVIDLRPDDENHSWAEEDKAVAAMGAQILHWPTDGFAWPPDEWFANIKNALTGEFNTLIHCQHGADRTGGAVAMWQMLNGLCENAAEEEFWRAQPEVAPFGEVWFFWAAKKWARRYLAKHGSVPQSPNA